MKIMDMLNDESGAVTVDWVVLTAAIIGISIAVVSLIGDGLNSASSDINTNLASAVSGANNLSGAAGGSDEGTSTTSVGGIPDGYQLVGHDVATGSPVYSNFDVTNNGNTGNFYVDGQIISSPEFLGGILPI